MTKAMPFLQKVILLSYDPRLFDVEVVVNEFQYRNRSIKNIIPVSLLGHAI